VPLERQQSPLERTKANNNNPTMPTDIDNIVNGFPHPTIVPINGVPTFETLADLNLQLNANAASVQSNLGDGQLGLLFLTVSPAEYTTLSNHAFIPPNNPGSAPNIPGGSTAAQITEFVRQHTSDTKIFNEYLATDKALKQQVIGAVNAMYLRTLRHRITGFANVTTRQMLEHLYAQYGRLSPADLQENDTRLRAQYDPNQPIESFFDQVEDAVALAAAANAPYTSAQIVSIAYNTIFSTGMFSDACRDWRRRPTADHNWVNFKLDFALAHQDLRDSQLTSKQSGYHNANAAYEDHANAAFEQQQETALALANLASATAADRSTVASLTTTNSNITAELAKTTAKLTIAWAEITALKVELASLKGGPASGHNSQRRTYPPNTNYCWTHGYKVNHRHNSTTCTRPAEGHCKDATRSNTMSGSQRGRE
jgi:hypothetical protein